MLIAQLRKKCYSACGMVPLFSISFLFLSLSTSPVRYHQSRISLLAPSKATCGVPIAKSSKFASSAKTSLL